MSRPLHHTGYKTGLLTRRRPHTPPAPGSQPRRSSAEGVGPSRRRRIPFEPPSTAWPTPAEAEEAEEADASRVSRRQADRERLRREAQGGAGRRREEHYVRQTQCGAFLSWRVALGVGTAAPEGEGTRFATRGRSGGSLGRPRTAHRRRPCTPQREGRTGILPSRQVLRHGRGTWGFRLRW